MAVYELFPGSTGLDADGPDIVTSDASGYTLAMQFDISALPSGESNPRVTAVLWWRAPDRGDGLGPAAPPSAVGVFNAVTTDLLGSETFADPGATTGRLRQALTSPVAVTPGTSYHACVLVASGANHYSATSGYWAGSGGVGSGGLASGIISAPDGPASVIGQGSFAVGGSGLSHPSDAFGNSNYYIGVEVTTDDAAGNPSGSVEDAVTWTVTATGHTDPHGSVADAVTWTDDAAGHAPTIAIPHGHVVDAVHWTTSAAGHAEHHGHVADAVSWRVHPAGHAEHHGHAATTVQWRVTVHGRSHQVSSGGPSPYPFGVPITLVKRTKTGQRDGYGKDIYAEDTSLVLLGVFDPAIGFERTDGMDQVSQQPQVLLPPLPPGVTVASVDQVEIDGLRYDVDGVANPWNSPWTGLRFGVAVPLKRVTG